MISLFVLFYICWIGLSSEVLGRYSRTSPYKGSNKRSSSAFSRITSFCFGMITYPL
ncbi:hypothetical protein Patl1_04650 [Pistacia atlantica]|uniref:Uncharacterized protein n=1 Tax=Pistacia atlantica TaxID=434234 RepID=A0ACC1BR52_9ROSI|nr:hypothetical protein Patl1_04650 [Pistacia atlantica]